MGHFWVFFLRDAWYMPLATFSMPLLGRKNNFPSILSFSGWSNHHIDMRQINIKNNQFNMYVDAEVP